jgi:hypothetical protein
MQCDDELFDDSRVETMDNMDKEEHPNFSNQTPSSQVYSGWEISLNLAIISKPSN